MKIEPEALYSLYDSLYIPNEIEQKQGNKQEEKSYDNRILMAFNEKINLEDTDFLNKILSAIRIKTEEVEFKFDITTELLLKLTSETEGYILTCGLDVPDFEKYKFIKNQKSKMLVIDSLNTVKNNLTLKTKLWNCLKDEFLK